MADRARRDFTVGVFVLAGLAAIAYLSLSIGGARLSSAATIPVFARFDQIAGLKARAPVEIAGVRVGQIRSIGLADDFRARVDMDIYDWVKLPVDTSAAIVTSGLLGDRYISLEPGAEDTTLGPGEEIAYTESAMVLERLVGKFLYNVDSDKE